MHSQVGNVTCVSPGGLDAVKARCNGLPSCSVPATTDFFTDACPDTYKYLNTTYTCVTTTANVQIACENANVELTCPEGEMVFVTAASFGRSDENTCFTPVVGDTVCTAAGAMATVSALCNGRSGCQVGAVTGLFGDPCPGTYKYLTVAHACTSSEVASKYACENTNLTLSCAPGKVMTVNTAVFGRSDLATCAHPVSGDTACAASESLHIVKESCDGTEECSVPASTDVFGDPCANTYKYLTATYTCSAPSSHSTAK